MSKSEILDAQPPRSLEVERAVLGSILNKPELMAEISAAGLQPGVFYDDANAALFRTFLALHDEHKPIDIQLVTEQLRDQQLYEKIGGGVYLGKVIRGAPSAANWKYYCERIVDLWTRRRLIDASTVCLRDCHNGKHTASILKELLGETEPLALTKSGIEYRRITCRELAAGDYAMEYLVEWTLVAGQPCIVAGPKKACKTTIVIDLAISLAIAGHFLGRFKVARGCKVLLMTGESGLATVQDTARRIAMAAGHQLADISGLIISDQLPMLGSADHAKALGRSRPIGSPGGVAPAAGESFAICV